jgi:hypothetical protein
MLKANEIKANFRQHNGTMSNTTPPLWSTNPNKSQRIIITNAKIQEENRANVNVIIGVSAPKIADIYNLTR